MTPSERRMAAALARLGVKFHAPKRSPRSPCESDTGRVRHLFYLPHGETKEVCARCGKERHGNEPREVLRQSPARPFLELECE